MGFLSVAMGAFGAHALRSRIPEDLLTVFETAVRYAMLGTAALLGVGLLGLYAPSRSLRWAGRAFTLGVALFSGSLWLLALSGMRWLGAITPLGGLSLLAGWALLGHAAWSLDRGAPTRPDGSTPGNS